MIPFQNTYANLSEQFYKKQHPAKIANPTLISVNRDLANELGIDAEWLSSAEGLAVLSGNKVTEGSEPLAQAYAGHQFGGWSPQLGDGRALLLGEVINSNGQRRDIQLKGSGRTYFSRGGDGKSALGPVIREFLMSEAMHALGVPTTRALAAVASGEKVLRETPLAGGILTRVASSHIRVGSFQYFTAQQDIESVKTLLDYSINRHYPRSAQAENPALDFLEQVITKQVQLVSHWMSLGFIHGVMNTDNFTISGETLDYGPCAMMDKFHPQCVFSAIDRESRYCWGNQASIAHWNLTRLAETLFPLIDPDFDTAEQLAKTALDQFSVQFKFHYHRHFCAKLGVPMSTSDEFVRETLTMLANQQIDYTLFFRHLTANAVDSDSLSDDLSQLFPDSEVIDQWYSEWVSKADTSLAEKMQQVNPVLIPRNHQVENAIQAAYRGDYSVFERLHQAWKTPYLSNPEYNDLEEAPNEQQRVKQTFCGT